MLHNDINRMLEDETGVSPVIGVILMVAVTVVLAALIGAFVFGLGDDLGASAPNAQIDFSYDGENLEITHDGGQSITNDNTGALFLSGDTDEASTEDSDGWADELTVDEDDEFRATLNDGSSVAAGNQIVQVDVEALESGDSISIQWEAPDGDQTATLGEFGVP